MKATSTLVSIAGRVAGEISKLRKAWPSFRFRAGRFGKVYSLDSDKVDYQLARELYENTNDKYKLGAWAAKPVINTCVGFMGVPRFRSKDENAQEILDDFFGQNVSRMQQTHRDALRDGRCYVWLTREESEEDKVLYPESSGARLVFNIIPPEMVDDIVRNPLTGRPIEYVLVQECKWTDSGGAQQKAVVKQRVSAQWRTIEVDGPVPPGVVLGGEKNKWGFLPIVEFNNEADTSATHGRSDLEPIEPFMKAYHDVMMQSISAHKMHSTPRLKLKLKDVGRFLINNFGIEDPAKFAQDGGTINLDGRELLIFTEDEEAEFIEVKSAIGSAKDLLKLLFFCIVDVSETPEFAFGTHTPSSHASVKEQMPVLVRRVARKREHFTESWERLARMVLAMSSKANGRRLKTYATTLIWDPIAERDEKEEAETLKTVVEALANAIDHNLMGLESAVNLLAKYVETMNEWAGDSPEMPGEREKIIRTRLLLSKLEDAPLSDSEQRLIDETLKELEKVKAGES